MPDTGFLKNIYLFYLFILFIYFIYILAASGLSCGTWDLSLRRAGFSLVVACGFSLSSCGAQAPGYVGSVLQHTGSLIEVHKLSSCGAWA